MNRIFLYSVDTASFYTDEEYALFEEIMKLEQLKKNYNKITKISRKLANRDIEDKDKEKLVVSLESVIGNESKIEKINKYIEELKDSNEDDKDEKIQRQQDKIDMYSHCRKMADTYLVQRKGNYRIVNKSPFVEVKKKVRTDLDNNKIELKNLIDSHKGIRELRTKAINKYNKIAQFESFLTRTLGIEKNKNTEDVMIVRVYSYKVMEQLIKEGYEYKGSKFCYYAASAGQIRNKKIVMINEKVYKDHEATLLCGLSKDRVNQSVNDKGELRNININKWTAYKALVNTASTRWDEFMDNNLINNSIVVPDFEFDIKGAKVEYINNKFEINKVTKTVANPVMDGAGIMLPSVSKKNLQIRAPFLKGLMVSTDLHYFLNNEEGANPIVKDVWGKEWNILDEHNPISVIFTASQLKMWQYYDSWEDYKNNFIKHKCEFSIAIEEEEEVNLVKSSVKEDEVEDTKEDVFRFDSKMNYQFLQTLTKVEDEDLKKLAENSINEITQIATNEKTMLKVLGAVKENEHRTALEDALMIYPELLADDHVKNRISDKKKAMVREAKAGRIKIPGSRRSFLAPDVYAFMQWLFLGSEKVTGLLQNGEVSCNMYEDEVKVDVLRSPHNYIEHAVRVNVKPKDEQDKINKYFTTTAVHTSVSDLIFKILQFDVDGDCCVICSDETLVRLAEEHTKDVLPLEYELKTGTKEQISDDTLYKGLVAAFDANIGTLALDIAKIFNADKPDMRLVKILCLLSNLEIDFAKTLYRVELPEQIKEELSEYKDKKLPYFFRYAKNKKIKQVEEANESTVNRLSKMIPNKRIKFPNIKGFDYEMLMNNNKVKNDKDIDKKIIGIYEELIKKNTKTIQKQIEKQGNNKVKLPVYDYIKDELLKVKDNYTYVTDVLIRHLFEGKNPNKDTFWNAFGSQVLANLKRNLDIDADVKSCRECDKEFKTHNNRQVRCQECGAKRRKEKEAERKRNKRTKIAS